MFAMNLGWRVVFTNIERKLVGEGVGIKNNGLNP